MSVTIRTVLACALLVAAAGGALPAQSEQRSHPLFPAIEPFETGRLAVSDLHEIYYELSGNPRGRPVMALHGGPGVGSYPELRRYFDPSEFLIVLHDQRGNGRSRPFGEIEENTTQDLVGDIERLRQHLGLDEVLVFGGSWGSTLGLAYAEAFPAHVSGLVLRGIFLGTGEEVEHHYMGARRFFPKEHDQLLATLPDPDRRPLPNVIFELIETAPPAERMKVLRALARFELKLCTLDFPDRDLDALLAQLPAEEHYRMARIDLHYSSHAYFLAEGQLLRDAHKVADIPAVLINGRYDTCCPPAAAYRLHKVLPQSKLVIVEVAGHSEREPAIASALVRAVKEVAAAAKERP